MFERLRWLLVPIGAYLVVTLVLPIANGAAARADFVRHTVYILAGCVAALVIAFAIGTVKQLWRNR